MQDLAHISVTTRTKSSLTFSIWRLAFSTDHTAVDSAYIMYTKLLKRGHVAVLIRFNAASQQTFMALISGEPTYHNNPSKAYWYQIH